MRYCHTYLHARGLAPRGEREFKKLLRCASTFPPFIMLSLRQRAASAALLQQCATRLSLALQHAVV
jgi:hypothetical protein